MALLPGTSLGPYEIESPLGAGGMGEVYKARDSRLGRVVAIKVLPADVADDPNRRERFDREAKVISILNHPHICALYDVGRQSGIDFLVMELQTAIHGLSGWQVVRDAVRGGTSERLTDHGCAELEFETASVRRPHVQRSRGPKTPRERAYW